MSEPGRQLGARALVVLAAGAIVMAGLKAAGALMLPFLVAVFISVLVAPAVLWLEQRSVPAWLAALVVMLAVVAGLAAFGALITQSMSGLDEALPRYQGAMETHTDELIEWLHRHGLRSKSESWLESFDPGSMVELVGVFLGSLVTAVSNLALVLLTVFFVLLEVAGFPRKLRAAVGDPKADLRPFAEVAIELQSYLWMKTVLSVLTGLITWMWLLIIGVDFPVLWGLLAFLLNYVPNVGAIIAGLPPLGVAMLQPELGTVDVLLVLLGFAAVHIVVGNIVEPQIFGHKLGLSPLVVFLSLAFWGWVWGPVGMLLSVPLTLIVKLMFERTDDLRWVAVLLGPSPQPQVPHRAHAFVAGLLQRRSSSPAGDENMRTWTAAAPPTADQPIAPEDSPGE